MHCCHCLLIPRAHILADVAAEQMASYQGLCILWELAVMLYCPVGDAFCGVQNPVGNQRICRAGFNAFPASSAIPFVRLVPFNKSSCKECAEQHKRAVLFCYKAGIPSNKSQP